MLDLIITPTLKELNQMTEPQAVFQISRTARFKGRVRCSYQTADSRGSGGAL